MTYVLSLCKYSYFKAFIVLKVRTLRCIKPNEEIKRVNKRNKWRKTINALHDLNWFVSGFTVLIHKSTHIIDYIHRFTVNFQNIELWHTSDSNSRTIFSAFHLSHPIIFIILVSGRFKLRDIANETDIEEDDDGEKWARGCYEHATPIDISGNMILCIYEN